MCIYIYICIHTYAYICVYIYIYIYAARQVSHFCPLCRAELEPRPPGEPNVNNDTNNNIIL